MLAKLDLSYNRLTEFSSDPFERNFRMESLDLSHNQISNIYEIKTLEVNVKNHLCVEDQLQ